MLVGTLYLGYVFDVHHIMSILEYILDHNAKPDIWDYFKAMGVGWLKTIIPFLGYTDLMVDGAPLPHQPDTIIRWLIDRPRS